MDEDIQLPFTEVLELLFTSASVPIQHLYRLSDMDDKEALNFQITLLLIGVVCVALTVLSCWILFPLLFVCPLLQIIYGIIAALAVRDGKYYRYPFNLRLFQ